MTIDKQALRERYSPQPIPNCRICGAEMTVRRIWGSHITYGCTGETYDDMPPVVAGNSQVIPDWWSEAERLAKIHGSSFVVFRNGESPQCADPSKVVISFTDDGLSYLSTTPQQEVIV